ncbi:hypothetical protein INT45_002001 [Circinella minor]|uniref:Uncharacterized protein n=1 Tax=Circinella minor TaxID=1195481 RepID=A0A8H7SG14_9FUNG|nr:hypothetical protein INT45_002001 [Circinella minor]
MRKTPYNPNVTNEQVKQQAKKANKAAEEYHRQREHLTAKSFDEIEFDYPNIYTDNIDPENSSWTDCPTDQCEVLLADDSILPKLGPEDTTPPTKIQKQSNEWIKKHLNDKPEKGSPYQQRPDGSADLVG